MGQADPQAPFPAVALLSQQLWAPVFFCLLVTHQESLALSAVWATVFQTRLTQDHPSIMKAEAGGL